MLKPNFKYTNKIVKLLTEISVAREVILNSPLIPKWEVTLRREALIHSAHSSTSIEGNRLSLEQVSELAQGREVMATIKDRQEVLNYLGVLGKLETLVKSGSIREEDILRKNIGEIIDRSDEETFDMIFNNWLSIYPFVDNEERVKLRIKKFMFTKYDKDEELQWQ